MGGLEKLLTTFTSSRANITSWHQQGRLISPSMGLKAGRVALKSGARRSQLRLRLLMDRDECFAGGRNGNFFYQDWEHNSVSPFASLSGRHLELFCFSHYGNIHESFLKVLNKNLILKLEHSDQIK